MTHDLVIRGGTVADGTGGPLREADVAVSGGRIVEVAGRIVARGREEIEAKGLLVTPGFVDLHTHYDGQATWDRRLAPSNCHGVTTAVMGNCGVGFAPVRPADRKQVIELMEGVEDIPAVVLNEGVNWRWESFPEYLDALEGFTRDMDIASQFAHGPLRLNVMGQRAARLEPATGEDVARMRVLAAEAIRAGAVGFTTSRTLNHRTAGGDPVPTLRAAEMELVGIGLGLKDAGAGVFELVSDFDSPDLQTEFALMRTIVERSGRPLSFSLAQRHAVPNAWRELHSLLEQAVRDGLPMKGQVAPRPVAVLLGLQGTMNPFSDSPSYIEIASRSLQERLAIMRNPEFRKRLLAEKPREDALPVANRLRDFAGIFPLGDPPDYAPPARSSVAAQAAREGRSPLEVAYDLITANGGRDFLFGPIANYAANTMDVCRDMIASDHTLIGLGDAGAHCTVISDASFPTFLLSYWGRDRPEGTMDLGTLVRRHTWDNAKYIGFHDRGRILPGMKADLNVIDFDKLALESPYMTADLPGGGKRLLQKARGYRATIVSGAPTYFDGEPTGALPGRLVRGPQVPNA